jgi:hypothetical protein
LGGKACNINVYFIFTEDAMFWRAIVQLGLIDEFFREVKSKLDVLKASMIKNYVPVGGNVLYLIHCEVCPGFELRALSCLNFCNQFALL